MASLSAPTFAFAPGKTWFMPVTYLQRNADGTAGAPVNLTGGVVSGILFARGGPSTGIPLTVANGGVTVDPTNGVMNFLVDETQSAGFVADTIPPFADSYNYPTRLEVDFRDTRGHLDVAAVFPIHVFDPRFVDPSSFPLQQAGTIVSSGAQGLPGAPSSVPGPAGASAYDIAVAGGFAGTQAQWLASLVGAPGQPGQSPDLTVLYTRTQVDQIVADLQQQINAMASQIAAISASENVPKTSFFASVFNPLLLS